MPSTGHIRCSVVIPTYDAAALLEGCLHRLLESLGGRSDVEVVVSDDGSDEDTGRVLAKFAGTVVSVRSAENRGFAHACNLGAQAARGESLVFYNNDLTPRPGWIDALLDYADAQPSAAVIGCKLLFTDGRIQHAGVVLCSDGYPRHVYGGFPADHPVVNRSGPARIVTAACMLVRASWFERLGGFDTGYRNGYEDVDLCLRANEEGGEVHYCAASELVHLVSATRERRVAEFIACEERFLQRWGHLAADDFARYVADGMLGVDYARTFPFRLRIADGLAVVHADSGNGRDGAHGDSAQVTDLLRQIHELRRENVRLRMAAGPDGAGD